ncbi:hypothetical protein LUZ61_016902 [Rhynchospora tenuis]|uniref:Replication protein A subunit n=1 Tax=Rhynchospora tenuis TaxID=198213 RepID=A0AAD6EKI3_9POAL|nr:hypothetical protein LUZ61_016902 [Rhynchospora tenuis]
MKLVLQISDVRQVSTVQNTTERYRMLLSDGTHTQQAMLATKLNSLVKEGNLQAGSIVQLNDYNLQVLQSKREIIETPRMYEIGTSPSLANNPNTSTSAKTAQTPQTGPFIYPRQHPPSNNPSYNANIGVTNMMNQPNFQIPKPRSPNLNPNSKGGQIRVTCFNNVAEHFYPKIEFGKVYFISKGSIKQANKKFHPLNHEYEMDLESGSMVEPCEDDNTIPGVTFSFCQISDIESLPSDTILDVIGVVTSISPASTVRKRNGSETMKRTLQLKDMSGRSVELTLWGNFVSSEGQQLQSICDSGQFPILAVNGARVYDFNGKSVSSIPGSELFVEPDCAETHDLETGTMRKGRVPHVSISFQTGTQTGRADNRKTCSQIKDEGLGHEKSPVG